MRSNLRHILSVQQHPVMLALLVLIPFVMYYPSLYYPFLSVLDDKWLILGNDGIKDFSLHAILFLFFHDTKDLHYMPVTYVSYSIDYYLFGLNPFMIKLHNLLLHILSGILLYIFIALLVKKRGIAFVIAILYLIHPMNIESVVWASCRKQALFYSFLLASLICYKLYLEQPYQKKMQPLYFLSIIFWIISTMAKATAITLPGVFVLLYIHKNRENIKIREIARQVWPTIPFIALFWYLNAEAAARNFLIRDFSYSRIEHLILAGYSYSFYWAKSIFPYPLVVFYPAPSEHLPLPAVYYLMFTGSCLLLALMIYHFFKKQNNLFFALGFYTITILPMLDLMYYPLGDLPMLVSNRYFYHSSLGILLYLVLVLDGAIRNRNLKISLVSAYLLLLIVLFKVHQPVWKNEISVFENDVKYYPSEEFLYKLALLYDEKGETDKAFACLEKGDQLGTDIWINNIWQYYQQRSRLYFKAEKYDRALNDINTAIQKKEFKTPHYDSMLEMDKKKIELLLQNNTRGK